ncbi:hypothetical protein [Rubricoccus marinus]|uniref:hypothetical protein n=1 Tax=Rubricoccus marinus TaxID=716817 RepID=UPI00117B81FA|nr:hypothetical protein [Rubricoccus marinus]
MTTAFIDEDGVSRRYRLPEIEADFGFPPLAYALLEGSELTVTAVIGSEGRVSSAEFEWGPPVRGVDTTAVSLREAKTETEHAFLAALRLNPLVKEDGGATYPYRPRTIVLAVRGRRHPQLVTH